MAVNYAYNWAEIDLATGRCIGVHTGTDINEGSLPGFIEIPVYDEEYCLKYYNQADGCWYEDAAFTIPWQSSLI